jgi:hypothetical protein
MSEQIHLDGFMKPITQSADEGPAAGGPGCRMELPPFPEGSACGQPKYHREIAYSVSLDDHMTPQTQPQPCT